MTKLNVPFPGFNIGARLSDSLIKQPKLMAMTYSEGDPVLLHALKGIAFRLKGCSDYGIVSINGVGYATK